MAEKKRLGINWGENSFSFAEVEKGKLLKSASVPFSTPLNTQSQDVPEGLRFTSLIQKAFQDLNVTSKKVSLCLPAKDIIFRSFIIPWMEPEEVKNVVDFEAIKYIPIKLEELSYTYQAITIHENNQKNIRVIFVAIRKDTLTKYMGILEHTGLIVEWAEPSPMSLVRVLEQKGHLSRGHGTAVVQIDTHGGKIIFVDHDVVQFVREFQLPTWDANNPAGVEDFTSRLFNEIRVSLNFYSRQNPQGKITKIIALSLQDIPKLTTNLSESLSIPASLVTASSILKSSSANEIGLLNAFGIGLRDRKSAFNNFNLAPKTVQPGLGGTSFNFEEPKYQVALGIVAFAIILVGAVFFLTKNVNTKYKAKVQELSAQQGPFETSTAEDVKKLQQDLTAKLWSYKDVQTKSKMSFYLNRIPQLLPAGTWLKTIDMGYNDKQITQSDGSTRALSKIFISIEGYAYVENTNEQFRLVNSLVTTLKGTKDIAGGFGSIELVAVRQDSLNNYPVTYFKVDFK
jgi:Tfp pilus assembly PilM family ATPase